MNIDSRRLFQQLLQVFTLPESKAEKEAILGLVLEHALNLSRTEVMKGMNVNVDMDHLQGIVRRLNQHEPVQYILGEAEFFGRKFKVDPSVLIPRPETELMVEYVVNHYKKTGQKEIVILDIGTGSGCIAITLALEIPMAKVIATDISSGALLTAKENAERLGATVQFHLHDILNDEIKFGPFDVVLSNPPYIPESEKGTMAQNVTENEPFQALYVPDSDPLLFHKAIAEKAFRAFKPDGLLVAEINERMGKQTSGVFETAGYKYVKVIQDLDGKDRFVAGNRKL